MTDGPITDGELAALFGCLRSWLLVGLAVSGGPDSLAMLYLYARWASTQAGPPRTLVLTVDHQVRAASRLEADTVAAHAKSLRLPHETLLWTGPKPATSFQEKARDARYRLLRERLAREDASPRALLTAHTQDDQAETLLMRLGRGSGLSGLAGIKPQRLMSAEPVVKLVRPLLDLPKARLEATLTALGIPWADDPTNTDQRFERPRLRLSASARRDAGLSNAALAQAAARLARADTALELATDALQSSAVESDLGVSASIDRKLFEAAPDEIRIRLILRLLGRLGGISPPPQLSEVERLNARWPQLTRTVTLGGCLLVPGPVVSIYREPGRVGLPVLDLAPGASIIWDNRFRVSLSPDAAAPCTVRSLDAKQWAALNATCEALHRLSPRAALTVPSFWTHDQLVAVPSLGPLRHKADRERHMACMASPQTLETLGRHCQAAPLSPDDDANR